MQLWRRWSSIAAVYNIPGCFAILIYSSLSSLALFFFAVAFHLSFDLRLVKVL